MEPNNKKNEYLYEKILFFPLRSSKMPVFVSFLLFVCLIPIVIIFAIIEGVYLGIKECMEELKKEEEKKQKPEKDKEKTSINKEIKSYKNVEESGLEKINFPQSVYTIVSVVVLFLLFLFYTSMWAKCSYNLFWVVILTISAFITLVDIHYLSKPKGTLYNKITRTITISALLFTVGAFPISMGIIGVFLLTFFNDGNYSRLIEPPALGWLSTSIAVFLFQIPKMIDFNTIMVNYLYSKGDKLYDKGKYKEAIEFYNEAKGLDTSNSPYYFYAMGLAYLGLNDYTQALYKFERAIKVNDTYPEFYFAIADTYLQLDDYKSGLDYIDKLSGKLDKKSEKYKEYEKFREDYINQKEERIAELEKEKREKEIKNLVNDAMAYKEHGRYNCALEQIKKAVELEPDNEDYKNLVSEIQKLLEKENKKIEELYNEAVNLSDSKDYKKAIAKLNIAVNISNKQEISTSKLTRLKNKIQSKIDSINLAQEKYNIGMKAYKKKDFVNAIQNLENAVSLDNENNTYKKNLKDIKQEFEDKKRFGKEFYDNAVECFNKNDFNNAVLNINKALDYINDDSYKKLKSEIETLQKQSQDKKEAQKLYEKALDMYNSNDLRFDLIIEKINSAINKNYDSKYSDLLKKVEKTKADVEADNYYKKAKEEYENKNFETAINYAKKSVQLCASNRLYVDFKQKLDFEYKEYKNDKEALDFYNEGVEALNNANFKDAIYFMEEALKLKPNNEEWQKLLEKVKTGKIDIMTCSKNALMTLDFIDNEKAEQIIEARNEGNIWYDYQEFAKAFDFQPHHYPDIEEKFAFPLKQGNKYGRRLDI